MRSLSAPEKQRSFLDHLKELRSRLIVLVIAFTAASVAGYMLYDSIISLLYSPFQSMPAVIADYRLYITSLLEGFATRIKVSLIAGFVLSFPVHLFNAVGFVFPGLKPKEKSVVGWFLVTSTILVVVSLYYVYTFAAPLVVKVLTAQSFVPKSVGLMLNFGKNVFLIFQFILAGLILFQLPLIAELLMVMNIVPRRKMAGAFRYIVVGIFVVAAILTPPDAVSQLMLALPLVVLFGLALLIAWIFRFGEG